MRITLLEPPLALNRTGFAPRHPPQYALTAAAVLQQHGHEVCLVDAFQEDLPIPETVRRVAETAPELILVVPWDYTRETHPDVTVAVTRRLAARLPNVLLGLAGSVDADHFRDVMGAVRGIGFAAVGEYDETIAEVADHAQGELSTVPGLLVREGESIVQSAPRPPVKELDRLPYPAWELTELTHFSHVPHRFRQRPVYPLLASRGCPFACACCSEAKYSKITRYRQRSVASVMAEIEFAVAHYGAREIQFCDATFGLRKAWVLELCDALEQSGHGLTWSVLSRVDVMTPELLQRMARAGCWNVLYGLESANQEALDRAGKRIRVEQGAPILAATREAGMETTASFILGLPGEGREEILRTIEWAVELDPDFAQFFLLKRYGDRGEFAQWGWVTEEWDLSAHDFRGPLFVSNRLSGIAELKALQQYAYRRFYLRARVIRRHLPALLKPQQLMRYAQGLWTLAGVARH